MADLAAFYTKHFDEIIEATIGVIQTNVVEYSKMPREELKKRTVASMDALIQDLRDPEKHAYQQHMRDISYDRFRQNIPLNSVQQVLRSANQATASVLRNYYADDPVFLLEMLDRLHELTAEGMMGMFNGYEDAQVEIISNQESALAEVSSPIVPVYGGILVLPLIGSVDSRRAGQIMEALLEAINTYSADVVILDITGVPVIDTGVANYLLQAARAARLLGSTVVLVGIGAEIAQTIVQLGIDLTGIVTRANLQAGVEYALELQGLAIRPR
ncbi:STAS domain-containing protein [Herpetosiphon llansteffanensis]|uniref:STAS domain-containing protein n=1 Tax=Herpetosiphon llansteffanensis TaxID=2094568 RepID=UPI000D7BA505|nr:STAS domain-containing protein [Herpetosiphon llansteffanensis]